MTATTPALITKGTDEEEDLVNWGADQQREWTMRVRLDCMTPDG